MRAWSLKNVAAVSAPALAACTLGLVPACSGAATPELLSCGPGTFADGGVCVGTGGPDASMAEAAVPADSRTASETATGTGDATADVSDAPLVDATPDEARPQDGQGALDADAPSDPCKVAGTILATSVQCDPACTTPTPTPSACQMAACAATVQEPLPASLGGYPYYIRTPRAPGTDPHCSTGCPGNEYVYGLGFTVPSSMPAFALRVSTPWVIVTGASVPFCSTNATMTNGCLAFPAGSGGDVYVMTADPAAPARNLEVDTLHATCP